MATKKTKKTSSIDSAQRNISSPMDYFKFGESYTSLILGIVVVIIASILLISFVRNRDGIDIPSGDSPDISATKIGPENEGQEGNYTVKEGDDLWSIAETETGSGYNWVAIQEANNISNPNDIAAGTSLVIPEIEESESTTVQTETVTPTPTAVVQAQEESGENRPEISRNSYTVVSGDTLWNIAQRKYNDGYQYVKIAQENNIADPDWILVGQELALP